MVDFDLKFLGALSTAGVLNITRPQYTISWSRDNQVALITDGGGIFIVDIVHTSNDPRSEIPSFIGNETSIPPCPSTKTIEDTDTSLGISLFSVLRSREKSEIFEVLQDPFLCPKQMVNADVHLYFIKVNWSHHPLKLELQKEQGGSQYLLGALDSHFRLQLFVQQQIRPQQQSEHSESEEAAEPEAGKQWKMCIDVTESYRNLLLSQFWNINVDDERTFRASAFQEYKRRMYEVAIVDFVWVPEWDQQDQESGILLSTTLITAHASGDVCIWKVCVSHAAPNQDQEDVHKNEPHFYLSLEFKSHLVPNKGGTTSSLNFFKLSKTLGLLVIGTTRGLVKVFRVQYKGTSLPTGASLKVDREEQEQHQNVYNVEPEGLQICEEDLMELHNVCCCSKEVKIRGIPRQMVQLSVFKKPNFLLPFEIEVPVKGGAMRLATSHPPLRVCQGTLTGTLMMDHPQEPGNRVLLVLTQTGTASWMRLESGRIAEVSFNDLTSMEEVGSTGGGSGTKERQEQTGGIQKRLRFGGLAISPNGAMIATSKTLAEYYNHLALRTPSILQFHSLFPSRDVWSFVRGKCRENRFRLYRVTDIFAAFRVMMSLSEQYLREVLDWTVPLAEKSVEDLQVVFWVLRMQPEIDRDELTLSFNLRKMEPRPFLQLKIQQELCTRRSVLVSDRIKQLQCLRLVQRVVENPEEFQLQGNLTNLQSLMMMYYYLETKTELLKEKEMPRKPRVMLNSPPRGPVCSLCSKPTKMGNAETERLNDEEFSVEHDLDRERIDGVLWHEQQHVNRSRSHPVTSCALSLLPISFPYRKCGFCRVTAMMKPAFGQDPICPFCNGFMELVSGFYQEENEEAEAPEPIQELMKLMQDQEDEGRREVLAPLSRKARIENMYIDN